LLRQDFANALSYFEDAANKAPGYVDKAAQFSEAIWTCVDRTQYALGQLPSAQQSLEPAPKNSPEDHLARLYLGTKLFHRGD